MRLINQLINYFNLVILKNFQNFSKIIQKKIYTSKEKRKKNSNFFA
jgi:hypothetical protein